MRLQFLGSGSAFTVGTDNYHSNMLLSSPVSIDSPADAAPDRHLLIDCGTDVRHAMHALGLDYRILTDVYVSHLHADHAGGLEWLGFVSKFNADCPKPRLYLSETLVGDLWDKVLSGGMGALHEETATLSSYFEVMPVDLGRGFAWEGVDFQLIQTRHVCDGRRVVPSFGLFFSVGGQSVFITTDTQFTPDRFAPYYEQADVIFHECETTVKRSGVHSNYQDLVTLSPSIKRKMWLYHYSPGDLPDAVGDGFLGFVERGQVFGV